MTTLRVRSGNHPVTDDNLPDITLLDRFIRYSGIPYALAVRAPYEGATPSQSVRLLCNLSGATSSADKLEALSRRLPVRHCDDLCVQMHTTPQQTEIRTLLPRPDHVDEESADWPQHLIHFATNQRMHDWFHAAWTMSTRIGATGHASGSSSWLCPIAQMQPLFPRRFAGDPGHGVPVLVQIGGPDRRIMRQHLLSHCNAPENIEATWPLSAIRLLDAGNTAPLAEHQFLYIPAIVDGLSLVRRTGDGPVTGIWQTCVD